ncbi:exodeoxyribonuclease V subunit beta [Bulleidia sp. zg-1006]|uniref:UvrD-helicase domain-containing protein n=1 Tax=Bulleidia sp. zg-1006 TaxID=2806552 RepID=UPI0019398103|nr:UvrD-helicase domain-containing protein [Bulleidia sp. zg-1006]QRG86707.1 UvrD-helicase domain-containing protein [Bulleidia sp. zg-1006]
MTTMDQQRLAIQERNTNVLVSASAGAGKTYMLIERLAQRVVQDHVSLEQILAVTFTKAAAAEMKSRLASKLHQLRDISDSEKGWIDRQLAILSKAEISTIDSFCLNLVKQYYSIIGLNPARLKQTLSGGQEKELQHLAFEKAFSTFYQQNPSKALELSRHFELKPLSHSQTLEKSVHTINDKAKSSSDYQAWMNHALSFYPKLTHFSDFPSELQDYFFSYWQEQLSSIQSILEQMKDCLISEKSSNTSKKIADLLRVVCDYQKELENRDYSTVIRMTKQIAKYQFRKKEISELSKQFTEIRNALEDSLVEEQRLAKEAPYLHDTAQNLLSLCQATELNYQQLKAENNVLDFHDMALFSLEILAKNNGYLAKKLQRKYAEIMVDEFQDTSALQNKILTMISNGHNLFRVGDLKQSIYGFRNAKPELMASLMQANEDKVYHLEHNYRSKDHIVQFTNALFGSLMNYENSSVPYAEEDQVTIGNRVKQEDNDKESSVVNIIQINSKDKFLSAAWIGQEILHLLEKGYSFKDICILTPSHSDKAQLRKAFDEVHIPYSIDEKQGFFKSSVVQTIMSFVQYFCNEHDAIHLFALLQSSLFEVQDIEFAESRLSYNRETTTSSFNQYFLDTHIAIQNRLEALKKLFLQEGSLVFLQALSTENDFYQRLSAQQKTNFDYLLDKIVQEEVLAPYDFLHWLERSEEEYSTESNAHLEEENLVKVETIHHSKGLQYKVVFLYKCDQNHSGNGPVEVSSQYGIGLDYHEYDYYSYHPSLVKRMIQQDNHRKAGEEFLRLSYVAVTRAEERLYLVAPLSKKEGSLTRNFILNHCNLGTLVQAALSQLPPSLYKCQEIKELGNRQEYTSSQDYPFVQKLPSYPENLFSIAKQDSPSHHAMQLKPLNFKKKNKTGQSFGTKVHAYLETLPNHPVKLDEIDHELPLFTRESILFYQNSDWIQSLLKTMKIQRELPYYYEEDGQSYHGIIDFIATNEQKAIIIDYKTDHLENEQAFIQRYQAQLKQYRMAFENRYPDLETWIYSLHLKKFICVKK